MSYYAKNRLRAQTKNTEPTLTDQSAASHTDLNVIVKQFRATGQIPPMSQNGISGDFSQFPHGLRDMIEHSRKLAYFRSQVPEQFKAYTIEELLELKPADIARILTPEKPPESGGNEDKK